ncbi:MarR family winged helix-turn-helix transcriptional regulator [Cetobacterium sp.]|uniref:MarR family winged helix-turn-helix transcriptional regulator n=1 Tax=Cetobacterium sp. TaxID=2071632 RepID=UPI003F306D03
MSKDEQCLEIICKMGKIFNFYSSYDNSQRQYFKGGDSYYEKEVHLLKYLIDNPEKTITEIADKTSRTKSSVSQVIKRLVEKELISIEKDEVDKRKLVFIPTEKGKKLDDAHRKYDMEMAKFLSNFLENYTEKDISVFLELLDKYNKFQKIGYDLSDIK